MRKRISIADCLDLVSDRDIHWLEIHMPDGNGCSIDLHEPGSQVKNTAINEWVKRQVQLKIDELMKKALAWIDKGDLDSLQGKVKMFDWLIANAYAAEEPCNYGWSMTIDANIDHGRKREWPKRGDVTEWTKAIRDAMELERQHELRATERSPNIDK